MDRRRHDHCDVQAQLCTSKHGTHRISNRPWKLGGSDARRSSSDCASSLGTCHIYAIHRYTSHILNFIRRSSSDLQLHKLAGADLFSSKSGRPSERSSGQSYQSERPASGQELAVVRTMVAVDSLGTSRCGCWRFPLRDKCENENWAERRHQ